MGNILGHPTYPNGNARSDMFGRTFYENGNVEKGFFGRAYYPSGKLKSDNMNKYYESGKIEVADTGNYEKGFTKFGYYENGAIKFVLDYHYFDRNVYIYTEYNERGKKKVHITSLPNSDRIFKQYNDNGNVIRVIKRPPRNSFANANEMVTYYDVSGNETKTEIRPNTERMITV